MKNIIIVFALLGYILTTCQITQNGRCGSGGASQYCAPGAFCSRWSWCGIGGAWSAHSSNSKYDGSAACVAAQQLPPSQEVIVKSTYARGKVLDLKGAQYTPGTFLQIYQSNGGDNQKFLQSWLSKTEFQLALIKDNKLGAGIGSGSRVVVAARDNNPSGTFTYNESTKEIKNQNGNCLDISRRRRRNSTPVLFWRCNRGNNQKWVFENVTRI